MTKGEYTVVVRGETFILGREQILYDSPNYFSTCFMTPSSKHEKVQDPTGPGALSPVPEVPEDGDDESGDEEEYELILHRDPYLFKLIEAYLSGYPILPLPEEWLPKYMSRDAALKALLVDARYYELTRLVDLLRAHLKTMAPKTFRIYVRCADRWREDCYLIDVSGYFDMYLDALDGQPGGDVLEGTGHHTGGGEDVHRVAQRLAECVPNAVPRTRAKPVLEDAGMLPSVGADAEWVSTAGRVCNSAVARGPIEKLF